MGCDILLKRVLVAAVLAGLASSVSAREADGQGASVAPNNALQSASSGLSAAQVFRLAEDARGRRDFAAAEMAYRALSQDANLEIRTEARFRLGMMLADELKRYSDAALEFRRILDDKPGAARVRLELARMQALMGNLGSARKELRAAEAAGLPSAVEQLVRFYTRALNARKPLGGSVELAFAPDSNINRATRSDTLGTVIGDFTLGKDAKAKSGLGVDLQGQGYARIGLEAGADLLVRASGSATLYSDKDFNDVSTGLQAGPQYNWNGNQLTLSAGPTWRWYGRNLYSSAVGGNVSWQRPVSKRSQLRVDGAIAHVDNKRNSLQTADDFTISAALDRAFSARTGGGIQFYGFREAARDPGYSLASGGGAIYLFREIGRSTLVGTIGYSHLEADQRLFLYPRRRIENRYSASLALTLRALHVRSFAPLMRVTWERNSSSIEIYDYRRLAAEFGVTSAF